MKWILAIAILISANARSEESIKEKINELNKEKAEAIANAIIEARYGKKENIKNEKTQKKQLKECIKANNVIDDEVKRCMDGK